MIFHIDGNSFYASCERLFRPDLYKNPIAVLSNNDGIIVAANPECKALGYKRGDVSFKMKNQMEKQGVKVFSSNYPLYADMSARMNLIYNRFAPEVELYSIDESFLFFPDWKNADYTDIGHNIKIAVTKETGIPVAVGIAPTKTLAKLCNKLAKQYDGVCNWQELNQVETLGKYPAGDIWGIGFSKTATLKKQGIHTALDLKNCPLHKAKKLLTITGFRTVQELNGIPAIDKIENSPRQAVMVSRSFQSPVYELCDIITALAEYTQEAVKRIREEHLLCRFISVYLMTNAYAEGDQYFNQLTAELPSPSSYLPLITSAANELLKRIYRPHYKYRKVMIGLSGLGNDDKPQLDLFEEQLFEEQPDWSFCDAKTPKLKTRMGFKHEPLMQAFDKINAKYGRGTIKLACGLGSKPADTASEPTPPPYLLKRDYLSPSYTTNIADIPLVY